MSAAFYAAAVACVVFGVLAVRIAVVDTRKPPKPITIWSIQIPEPGVCLNFDSLNPDEAKSWAPRKMPDGSYKCFAEDAP